MKLYMANGPSPHDYVLILDPLGYGTLPRGQKVDMKYKGVHFIRLRRVSTTQSIDQFSLALPNPI